MRINNCFQNFAILFGICISFLLTNVIAPLNIFPKFLANPNYDRPFQEKRTKLYSELEKLGKIPAPYYQKLIVQRITVNRNRIFEDSFKALNQSTVRQLLNLEIHFEGEIHPYAVGLHTEWFNLLTKDLFHPDRQLFEYLSTETFMLQINALSQQFQYFEFVGKMAALAICIKQPMDVNLSRPFLKLVLNLPVDEIDIQATDPEYYKQLMTFKKDPSTSNLYFQISELGPDGKILTVDLKPSGNKKKVTRRNVNEYIRLVIKHKYQDRVEKQMEAFLNGFKTLVPLNLIKYFKTAELELLMCGVPVFDMQDWKKHTHYVYYRTQNELIYAQTIKWMWEVIESFSDVEKAKLLYFVTGSSRLPVNGFKEFALMGTPFRIDADYKESQRNLLPRSSTCLRLLTLPVYDDREKLRKAFTIAINEAVVFGL